MKMPIPNDFNGEICRFAILWPNSVRWRSILRGLVTNISKGYFWDERTGNLLEVLELSRSLETYNVQLQEVIMACADESLTLLIEAVNSIAEKMPENCGCGTGSYCQSGNVPNTPGGILPILPNPGTEELDPAIDPPPSGFETWEAFFTNKCKAANFIFDSSTTVFFMLASSEGAAAGIGAGAVFGTWLVTIINSWLAASAATGILVVDTALLAGGALALLTVGEILLIVGAIAAVVAVVGVSVLSVFNAMLTDLREQKQEVICALYEAQTITEARTALSDAFSQAITSIGFSPPYDAYEAAIKSALSAVVGYLLTDGFLNVLFQPSNIVDQYTGASVDCGVCGVTEWYFVTDIEGWEWSVIAGTLPSGYEGRWGQPDPNDPTTGYLLTNYTTQQTTTVSCRWERDVNSSTEFEALEINFGAQVALNSVTVTVFSPSGNVSQTFSNQGTGAINLSFTSRVVTAIRIDGTFTNSNPTYSFSTYIYSVVLS